MRFFKGGKVEVLQEAEVPLGSWRRAEIISGNGRSYYVRYDPSPVDSGVAVERVPRRLIRPCPPPSDDHVCWTVGNILEAFDSYSWKVAEMVRVLGKNHYLVRLLGSSLELRAHESDLRLRKLWQDEKWIVIQKDPTRFSGGSFKRELKDRNKDRNFGCQSGKHQQLHHAVNNNLLLKNHTFEGNMSRGVKRKSAAISTHPTQFNEVTKRVRTPHRDGRQLQLVAGSSLHLVQKVDAVDSPCIMLGKKYMHASLNMKNHEVLKTNLGGLNTDADHKCHPLTTADPSDTMSMCSSVGSCSPSSSPCRSQYYNSAYQSGDDCSRNGDAEASASEREIFQPDNNVPREETHLLELHAYRATMLALYAWGSISWEQEALLTNLRLTLNISTDEHLAELRNLVYTVVTSI